MHEHNDAECTEAARLHASEVIAGDVLHDASAALHHAAIAGHERDAEEMVFDGAVAVTQRTGGRRRDYRAERAAREPGGSIASHAPRSASCWRSWSSPMPASAVAVRSDGSIAGIRSSLRVVSAISAGASLCSQVPAPSIRTRQPS